MAKKTGSKKKGSKAKGSKKGGAATNVNTQKMLEESEATGENPPIPVEDTRPESSVFIWPK